LHASPLSFQLTAPALALLLVFRTEASYSRYDEARKTWTKVISSAKDVARQSMAWAQKPSDFDQKKQLLDYILAFPVALKCHLLYGSDFEKELREILKEDDLALVLSAEHRPNCLIQLMTHSLKCLKFEDGERSLLDASMSQMNESISVCERLIRTPIPLAYTRLTSRILVLWHLALPVVLWDDCHWVVVPATIVSAASLFCIEEVGVLIEEPFPILPLDRMCAKARENIQELAHLQVRAQDHLRKKAVKPKCNVTNGVTRL
jgi:predicted membrane chloride channel (bestrophin family)